MRQDRRDECYFVSLATLILKHLLTPKAKTEKMSKRKYRPLRIIGRISFGFFLIIFLLLLLIRSEWGQNLIVNKVTSYVSDKTDTTVSLGRLFISFDGDIVLEELFLDTPTGDTLVYSKHLEVNMPLWPIIRGKGIGVEELESRGLKARITREDTVSGFNFQFLIDAFATDPTTQKPDADGLSDPVNFILKDLLIKEAHVIYTDGVTGIDSEFSIGLLRLSMEKTDLENMHFAAYEGLLENTTIAYKQSPISAISSTEDTPLPSLAIESFVGKNVTGVYDQVETGMLVNFRIPDLNLEIPNVNLTENTFEIRKILLKNGFIDLATQDLGLGSQDEQDPTGDLSALWPPYIIAIEELSIANTTLNYAVNNAKPQKGVFNPDALFLRDINISTQDLYVKKEELGVIIKKISGIESSGLDLKNLSGAIKGTDTSITVASMNLALNQNRVLGDLQITYKSLDRLLSHPEETRLYTNLPTLVFDVNDVVSFDPSLGSNEYVQTLSQHLMNGSLTMNGSLSEIVINELRLAWSDTRITGSGVIYNASTPDLLNARFYKYALRSQRSDILKFMNQEALSVQIPEQVDLTGSLSASTTTVATNSLLKTSQGAASLQGEFAITEPVSFDAAAIVTQYNLGALLQNEQLGSLTGSFTAKGKGNTLNALNALVKVKVDSFTYNKYIINDLHFIGTITDGQGTLSSKYKDDNLHILLNSTVKLDSVSPEFRANVDVIGADLKALGIMSREVRAGGKIEAFFKGSSSSYDASAVIQDGVIVYDNKTYQLGGLDARALIRPDTTTVSAQNKMLDIHLQSNTDPAAFAAGIQEHISSYFYRDVKVSDTISKPIRLKVRGKIAQTPLLKEVFLVNVKDLDTINLRVDFDQARRQLDASIQAPHINYSGNEIDSLSFVINTSAERFDFDLGFNAIKAGPISIGRTNIQGHQVNNELKLDFLAFDDQEKLIHLSAGITGNSEKLRFHVDEEELIFNRKLWTTPATNEVIITEGNLDFNDFRFKRNSQEVNFNSNLPQISKQHLGLEFVNFKLQELLSYLNPDEKLATGNLNGHFIVEDPNGKRGFLADLKIMDLGFMEVQMGTLDLNAKALGGDTYDFAMDLSGGAATVELLGDYTAKETDALITMDLAVQKFDMEALAGLSGGQLVDGSGTLAGNFTVNGLLSDPYYEGELRFNKAGFTIAAFNAAFTLPNEKIAIDTKGLSMDAFQIKDANGNTLTASGSIGTESFLNPTFNLKVNAQNFQALNASKEDNNLVYGKAVISAKATIKGDLEIPVVEIQGTVNGDTDITYIMPSSTANIESREGIVLFVNREDPDAILTRNEEETATITGFDIKSFIEVIDGAKVKIILDERTGDHVQVTGKGEVIFTMLPNGRMTLTGGYEMSDGQYALNLYNLVNRTFDIAPGSRISWSGDPFNASLDIQAIYTLETSASSLMASTSSGVGPSEQGKFRQVLPFLVYLNVDGELTAPKLTFGLDMPEDEQGAIGGQVYGRIQQVNSQEGELNRQVFSLLVLNRFYPDPGSDGSKGGFATIARDNLNDALSDQLNVFSDKLLGKTGVEINFGLDSYTDYQGESPQERTQLDIAAQKKLFDDRLIVTVGSAVDVQGDDPNGESTPLVGNVSLEYILTSDGRYRIKGFRRNEFENVIDGQTIASGIGLIFTQEFNKFSELWDAILRSKTKQLKEEEKRKAAENKIENKDPIENQDSEDNTDNE